MIAKCVHCGLDIPLVGRNLDQLRRHRKYARRVDGRPTGPAGNVCAGSGAVVRYAEEAR